MSDARDTRLFRPSVEVNLTAHCNLSCYGCDHASPLLAPGFADVDSVARDLAALASVFHAGEIRLVGGEPLLHPEVVELLGIARRSGIASRVVVYTNGVLLERMPVEFWESLDDLRVSVYPGVRLKLSLAALAVICAERGIRLEADAKDFQFQRTLLNQPIEDDALRAEVFRRCEMIRSLSCHTVHEGRFYLCSIAPFQGPRLARLGIVFDNRADDGIRLHDNPDLRQDLVRCLAAELPLAACRYCLGTAAPWAPHRQMDARARADWLAEDHTPLIAATRRALATEGG